MLTASSNAEGVAMRGFDDGKPTTLRWTPVLLATAVVLILGGGSAAPLRNGQVVGPRPTIRTASPEDVERFEATVKRILVRSTEGLNVIRNRDGSQGVALEGRFRHAAIAVAKPDGSVDVRCVGDAASASSAVVRARETPALEEE
jgi:hypothetical protein